MSYLIHRAKGTVDLAAAWDSSCWQEAEVAEIEHFRPEGSDHRPHARAKMVYDDSGLYLHFLVDDCYVLARHHGYHASVYLDSCVEFFVQPFGRGGYFNFEQNCGGSRLVYFVRDHTRGPDGMAAYDPLTDEEMGQLTTFHSLPEAVEEEITAPVQWRLAMHIPFRVLAGYVGPIATATLPGSVWRGNFYKCADESSHPHWASWQPVPQLNFHWPDAFGELVFA
ncbi:MAG: carbohydrate-binding family 9-like protein [Victivallales bacterium]|nr:carbohydrate-binding family 9-like protein [Victivallales bacterium]